LNALCFLDGNTYFKGGKKMNRYMDPKIWALLVNAQTIFFGGDVLMEMYPENDMNEFVSVFCDRDDPLYGEARNVVKKILYMFWSAGYCLKKEEEVKKFCDRANAYSLDCVIALALMGHCSTFGRSMHVSNLARPIHKIKEKWYDRGYQFTWRR